MKNLSTPLLNRVLLCSLCLLQFTIKVESAALTFDESPPAEYRIIENGYGGLQWTNFFIANGTNTDGLLRGIISSPCVAFNFGGDPATISSGANFTLGSASLTGAYSRGMQIWVRGYSGTTLIYDNYYGINGNAPTLIHFNYVGVDQVKFTGGLFAMDNLSLEVSGTNTGCTFAIDPDNAQHNPSPEPGFVSVFTGTGCIWDVVNTNSWVRITSGLSNTNSGTVRYVLEPNVPGVPRSGVIAIAGQAFTVTQSALGQPQDTSGVAYGSAHFSVGVTNDTGSPPLSYQWRRNGVNAVVGNYSTFGFIVSPSDTNAQFDCVVTIPGLTNTVTSRAAKVAVDNNVQMVAGSLKDEYWPDKNRIQIETDDIGYPPTISYFTNFETPINIADNYAQRITGFFTPAVSGNYVFFVASSHDGDLFLSTDDQPANLLLIAQDPEWSTSRIWTTNNGGFTTGSPQKRSDTFVDPVTGTTPYANGIPLAEGTRYYIEGVHHEGGGPDNFAVTFKVNPTDPDPVNGDAPRFTRDMLSHVDYGTVPNPKITITSYNSTPTGTTLWVSWTPGAGHLESSPVLPAASWLNLGYANPAYVTIGSSNNVFLRVVSP